MFIGNRYQLDAPLGEGSMGMVYQAHDRLTGEMVALKRVVPDSPFKELGDFSSPGSNFNVALAKEFQMLASLRHPNVISVLDYGFDVTPDTVRQGYTPYYTMQYLAQGQPIHTAAEGLPLVEQVKLLIQLLQALAYLHRRGILHRDLKPSNVLVQAGTVKVLDFGLSIGREAAGKNELPAGTITYMAPEILRNLPASEASDLYAVGVIACQVLLGHLPYPALGLQEIMHEILEGIPALDGLPLALHPVLARLLAKNPLERYPDATSVIEHLRQGVGLPPEPENLAIRESFLQAARFVGRKTEYAQLREALAAARQGKGSAWLVGGESGVGKSRLLNELRIEGLVQGMIVLRGQATENALSSYQMWRDPLHRLCLTTTLSDLEAGILKELAPNISQLLERPIPDPPPLADYKAAQHRLIATLITVFRRQSQPMLLLLEDLQWAEESLEVLKHLTQQAEDLPLLVVGNYRDDEKTTLSADLPAMQILKLNRLSEEALRELSASILGAGGRQPEIITLLQRETEGNTFFALEVVRALADKAGSLENIEHITLPTKVFAKGIQTILQRRLEQVSAPARELLTLVAVIGRRIDLNVLLQAVPSSIVLEDWLTACSNAAILETQDQQWQFSHDKLRDALLAAIPEEQRPSLARQAAEAIEATYGESRLHAATLVEQWHQAGDRQKEARYAWLAAEQASQISAYEEAIAFYQRVLTLPSTVAPALVFCRLGERYMDQGDFSQAQIYLEKALTQADPPTQIKILVEMGELYKLQGKFDLAGNYLEQAMSLSQGLADEHTRADVLAQYADYAWQQGQWDVAKQHLLTAQGLYQTLEHLAGQQVCALRLGIVAAMQDDLPTAQQHFEASLAFAQTLGDRNAQSACTTNLGQLISLQGDYTTALHYFEQALKLHQDIGNQWGIALNLINLGGLEQDLKAYDAARRHLEDALQRAAHIDALHLILGALMGVAYLKAHTGEPAAGLHLVCFVQQHPAAQQEILHSVQNWLTTFQMECSTEPSDPALTLDSLVQQVLQELQTISA